MIREYECVQEKNTVKLEIARFYVKNTLKMYVKRTRKRSNTQRPKHVKK